MIQSDTQSFHLSFGFFSAEIKMKELIVFVLCFQALSAVMHSWKAFYTGSRGLRDLPEFVALNLLDDELMGYFDSRTNSFVSKMSWMTENLGQDYEEQETNTLRGTSQSFKANIGILMERFNQTEGVHIVQTMYGCEWDDETKEVNGYEQYGYDGEDFVSFDLKTETWIAPQQQAVITKHKWENNKALNVQKKNYLEQECPEWVKKYVNYGSSSLMRTVLPSVSLLQKTSSSPVTCHATGFHPNRATMFWRKDGDELHEGVDQGEILHNNDGTFQQSVDLDLTSVPSGDWEKYECVFQLLEVKDQITKLDKAVIRTNEAGNHIIIITVIAAVVLVGVLAVLAVVGFLVYKKKTDKRPPSPVENREVQQQMLPTA